MRRFAVVVAILFVAGAGYAIEPTGKAEVAADIGQKQVYMLVNVGLEIGIGKKVVIEPYYQEQVFVDTENFQYIEKNIISNEYEFGATLSIGSVFVGVIHTCFHPINSEQIPHYNTVFKAGWEW